VMLERFADRGALAHVVGDAVLGESFALLGREVRLKACGRA
jgi:hypothetical protein